MTAEQYDALRPDEQRIKVALLHGYTLDPEYADCVDPIWDNGMERCHADQLPDFLSNLNACHEFEENMPWPILGGDVKVPTLFDYCRKLRRIVRKEYRVMPMTIDDWELLHATAAQRCKAFVLTMTEGDS